MTVAMLCQRQSCNDPQCDREHVEQEPVIVGTCASCERDVTETEAVEVRGRTYHEDCAERLWPYDQACDPGIPKH